MADIGFIGLGIMGTPMAQHLIDGGHTLFVNTRGKTPRQIVDAGATVCESAREVKAEFIILMVPDTPNVEEALFATNGVAQGLTPGKIVIDMSSISLVAKQFAQRIDDLGCEYLDAPVSGGQVGRPPRSRSWLAACIRPSRRRSRCSS
ncbi:NAD(P)-dependent oxidoreductase [Aromatoleum buckelii]|nr:NAD(P)-dependent oxidoreductase [Aromatoleum buckelii]MCK0512261.1 NAD(P)-dependent oxidoreductase [Aromatoleum buckelii]